MLWNYKHAFARDHSEIEVYKGYVMKLELPTIKKQTNTQNCNEECRLISNNKELQAYG